MFSVELESSFRSMRFCEKSGSCKYSTESFECEGTLKYKENGKEKSILFNSNSGHRTLDGSDVIPISTILAASTVYIFSIFPYRWSICFFWIQISSLETQNIKILYMF